MVVDSVVAYFVTLDLKLPKPYLALYTGGEYVPSNICKVIFKDMLSEK